MYATAQLSRMHGNLARG